MAISISPINTVAPIKPIRFDLIDLLLPTIPAANSNVAILDDLLNPALPIPEAFANKLANKFNETAFVDNLSFPTSDNDNITDNDTSLSLSSVLLLQKKLDNNPTDFAVEPVNTDTNNQNRNISEEESNVEEATASETFNFFQPDLFLLNETNIPANFYSNLITALQGGLNSAVGFKELDNRADLEV